jgi:hypothetical protein
LELLPAPAVHADLAASAAFAAPDEHGAAALIEIAFGELERFPDPEPGPSQDYDEAAKAPAVGLVPGGAHDGDDLLDLWWVGGVAQTLVARRSADVETRHGRGRSTSTSAVE